MTILAHYFVAFFLFSAIQINVDAFKSYSRHQLWRLHVTNDEQVTKLLDFRRLAHNKNINFWSDEIRKNLPV